MKKKDRSAKVVLLFILAFSTVFAHGSAVEASKQLEQQVDLLGRSRYAAVSHPRTGLGYHRKGGASFTKGLWLCQS